MSSAPDVFGAGAVDRRDRIENARADPFRRREHGAGDDAHATSAGLAEAMGHRNPEEEHLRWLAYPEPGVRPVPAPPSAADLLVALGTDFAASITHIERLPARAGRPAAWPEWAPEAVVSAFRRRNIIVPWRHQRQLADLVHGGAHAVIATGTASGKSLGYQLPILSTLLADPRATALYLSPTKALTVDQLGTLEGLGLPGIRPAAYDGDTPLEARDWVRDHARWVLSNPDMVHRAMLPFHPRWGRFLRRLRFVVIDECHSYRGVFGSHVALVLRRLRRVARLYGSDPVFVFASATVAEPARAAGRLIGSPVAAVTEDASPSAGVDFVLWEPPVLPGAAGEHDAPVRRSAPAEAAQLMATLVAAGARTLTFVRSRRGAEQTALAARRRLLETHGGLADRVAAYRGGFLPEDRRALERALDSGELLGVASTNALELGVDITGLDAAVLAGYPGTLASVWQQSGRAGRGGRRALAVFIARDDPLDTYLVHHPEAMFGRAVEAATIDPSNPHLLDGQLACAAAERHLTGDDLELFGGPEKVVPILDRLVERGVLRRRPHGWFHTCGDRPTDRVDLRGTGGQVAIVEMDSGRLLGTVDEGRAPGTVHPGAVHLHQGDSYCVLDLDLAAGVALVRAERVDWTTFSRSVSTVEMAGEQQLRELTCGIVTGLGPVRVTEQVVGYLRQRPSGEVIDTIPLDMPEHVLTSRAVWFSIPVPTLATAGVAEKDIPGALHAAEHAAIGLLPLYAGCDRWDIGGLSTRLHPDTGEPTVIVYDGFPDGAGFADRGHQVLPAWLAAVRDAVRSCACAHGCPSCVQSPKCGNGNNPLDKAGAVRVLDAVLCALTAAK